MSTTPSVNPQLLEAMQTALKLNPLTADLSDGERFEIAILAVRDNRMQEKDLSWLEQCVLKLKQGEALSGAPAPQAPAPGARPPVEIAVALPQTVTSLEHWHEILEAHAAWIKKVLEPGVELGSGRANLKGSDLRAFPLEGIDLRAANLEGCDLSGCSLIASNFAGANLSKAKLNGACLDRARLRRCNLAGADFSGASLKHTDLRHAQIQGAKWDDADLSDTVLEAKQKSLPSPAAIPPDKASPSPA